MTKWIFGGWAPHQAIRWLAALILVSGFTGAAADQPDRDTPIVGVGAHFSWLIFSQLKDELETLTGRSLELHGEGSLLGVGCNAGIKNAQKNRPGAETFGFVCCPLSDEEVTKKGLIVYPLAREPILTLVHADNPVRDLSAEQVRAIFSGKIANWKEVGGFDKPIIVVARLHCKHRPGHWKTILPSADAFRAQRLNVNSAGEMIEKISGLPNAIGHTGSTWDFRDTDRARAITVDGHAPTADNLRAKRYPFYRRLSAVTDRQPGDDVVRLIRHAQTSPSFLALARKYELLPLNDLSTSPPP